MAREYKTQMEAARKGIVTPEIEKVAAKERMTVEELMPLVKIQNMDKILTMEYHMGYIKPYSEVERLRDMAA